MSFAKSKLKRFNEEKNCAPPPGHYNPKNKCKVQGGVLDLKGGRFNLDKDKVGLPGPGSFDISCISIASNTSMCPVSSSTPHKSGSGSRDHKNPFGNLKKISFNQSGGLLSPDVVQLQKEIEELNVIRKAQENELNKKQKELAVLKLKIASSEQMSKKSAEQVKQFSDEMEEMRVKMSTMTLEKDQGEGSLKSQQQLCLTLEEELKMRITKENEQKLLLDAKCSELTALELRLSEASEKSKQLHAQLQCTTDQSSNLQDQVQQLEELCADKDKIKRGCLAELTTLRDELTEVQQKQKQSMTQNCDDKLKLEQKIAELKAHCRDKENELSHTSSQLRDEQMILSSFEQKTEQEHLEQESKLVDMKEKILTLESNIAEHDVELKENVRLLQVMTDDHALQLTVYEEEVSTLRDKVSVLEKTTEDRENEIVSYRTQVKTLKGELDNAHCKLAQQQNELREFLQENGQLQSQLTEVEKEQKIQKELLDVRQSELSEVTNSLQNAQEYQAEIEQQLKLKNEQVSELEKEQKDLYDEIADIKVQEDIEVMTIQQKCDREKKHAEIATEQIQEQLTKSEEIKLQLEQHKTLLQQQVKRLERELKSMKLEALDHDDIIRHLKGEVFVHQDMANQESASCLAVQQERIQLSENLEELKEKEQILDTNLRAMTDRYFTLENSIKDVELEGKRCVNELQIKLTAVKLSLAEAHEENQCMNSLNTHLLQTANEDKRQVESFREKVKQLEHEIERLTDLNNNLQTKLVSHEQSVSELSNKELRATTSLTQLKEENNDLMERLSSSTQINTELEEKMVDLDLVQQRLEVNVNFLEESNRELKFERQTLNMKIYDLTDEVETLRTTKSNVNVKQEAQISKLTLDNSSLDSEVSRLTSVNQELRDEVVKLSVENCTLLEEITALRECARVMEVRVSELEEHTQASQNTEDLLTQNAEHWKKLYEDLREKVAPFQDQLDKFEMEKNFLLNRNQDAEKEMSKLSDQYAQLLGHQNQKQKIHHVIKLKSENLKYKEETRKLSEQLRAQKKKSARLEDTLKAVEGRKRFDHSKAFGGSKENIEESTINALRNGNR